MPRGGAFSLRVGACVIGVAGSVAAAQNAVAPESAQLITEEGAGPRDPEIIEPCNLPPQASAVNSTWDTDLWPGGVVPYVIDPGVTALNRDRLRGAMDELELAADLHFIPRTNEEDYIYVQNGGGNNSFVGRIGGGQTINLVNWSVRYIICHEVMHALGMWHEQQRPDRDSFVVINNANIQSGYEHNFTTRAFASVVGPFDFESVMLYHPCSFSICCPAGSSCGCAFDCASIQALPQYASLQSLMGNRAYLSTLDKAGLVARYGAFGGGGCGTSDFNGDGDFGTDADIEAFFACLAGNCCANCFVGGADFNRDGDTGTDADIEAFFRVLAGAPC